MDYNSIQYLNKIFGHSDVETTLRYIGYYECAGDNGNDDGNKD